MATPHDFSIELPLRRAGSRWTTRTHVVELTGDRDRFLAELARRLAQTRETAVLLTSPVTSLGSVADALNAIGAATVQSIDELSPAVIR